MGRNRILRATVFAALVLCSPTPSVFAQSDIADLQAIENAFVALAEKVSPSVVAISTKYNRSRRRNDWGDRPTPMIGSGVVIDADGLILTNDHVVRSGDRIYAVVENGERYRARIVSRDERSDLAVIRIDASDLVPAEFGDLAALRVGQFALAMGNPFGSAKDGDSSLSYGIVSALGKSLQELEEDGSRYYGNLIQTTADINPGNSGGPLFDIKGRVIGIATAIETRSGVSEGLGYAIPISSRTRRIIDILARGEKVEYGFLGVDIANDASVRKQVNEANPWGVVVTRVFPRTPAESAGIREDDLIMKYAAEPVKNGDHLVRMVGATPVGETVPLVIYRDRHEVVIEATISPRPKTILAGGEK